MPDWLIVFVSVIVPAFSFAVGMAVCYLINH